MSSEYLNAPDDLSSPAHRASELDFHVTVITAPAAILLLRSLGEGTPMDDYKVDGYKLHRERVPDGPQDGLRPISERLYEWALPFVLYVLAVVLLATLWF